MGVSWCEVWSQITARALRRVKPDRWAYNWKVFSSTTCVFEPFLGYTSRTEAAGSSRYLLVQNHTPFNPTRGFDTGHWYPMARNHPCSTLYRVTSNKLPWWWVSHRIPNPRSLPLNDHHWQHVWPNFCSKLTPRCFFSSNKSPMDGLSGGRVLSNLRYCMSVHVQ